jgi:hypothetical protein
MNLRYTHSNLFDFSLISDSTISLCLLLYQEPSRELPDILYKIPEYFILHVAPNT